MAAKTLTYSYFADGLVVVVGPLSGPTGGRRVGGLRSDSFAGPVRSARGPHSGPYRDDDAGNATTFEGASRTYNRRLPVREQYDVGLQLGHQLLP